MNGIQNLILHFVANAIGHKASSFIGLAAAALLAGLNQAVSSGLIDLPALKPDWAHYVTLAIAALSLLAGLAANPDASKAK